MSQFHYKGRKAGEPVQGVLEGSSREAIARSLFGQGITPIEITPHKEKRLSGKGLSFNLQIGGWPKIADLVLFARQMYSLSRAGVSMIRAIRGLAETSRNVRLADALKDVMESLESGRTLSQSMAKHPRIFPNIFIGLVQVGENTGHLDNAFLQISSYLEQARETQDRIKQAMRYPIIVLVAITGAIITINALVIPAFAGVFASMGSDLPTITLMLIAFSDFTVNYWPVLLTAAVLLIVGMKRYIATDKGRLFWDHWQLRIPVVGSVVKKSLLARFARSFGLSLKSGVPLVQGLNLTAQAVENRYLEMKIHEMRSGVERGDSILRTAAATKLFPPLVLQMLAVGEETGGIDTLLHEVADYYEREVEYDLKNLSSAIEPLLIVAIGAMVLVLALGVFLPMWDLAGAAR